MNRKRIWILILLLIFSILVFSLTLTIHIFINFSDYDIYEKTSFKDDIEISLVITIINFIGNVLLYRSLSKNGILRNLFNKSE